jgi:hypothetical protein
MMCCLVRSCIQLDYVLLFFLEPAELEVKISGADYTIFMKALQEAVLVNDILTINCSPDVCKDMGFPPSSSSSTRFLIRKDYQRLWAEILNEYAENAVVSRKSIVMGTVGIGKSLFRFYLIWKWLMGDQDIAGLFRDIRFNLGNSFYLVQRDGTVLEISEKICLWGSAESLVLLDPCHALSGMKDFWCKLLIITSSPSSLVGHSAACNLSQVRKLATIFVMRMWTEEEWFQFSPDTDKEHFAKFSSRERLTTYCVPRWLTYRPKDIAGQLKTSLNGENKGGLCKYLLSKANQRLMSSFLPYCLCKVRQPCFNDWEVYGFISDYVTNHILIWARIRDQVSRTNFVSLLVNPWSGGLLGHCFENWAFELLETQTELIVFDHQLGSRFQFCSMKYFQFIPRKPIPCILNNDEQVLQRPDQGVMPSIGAYGVVGNTLLLLQFAVGATHSAALWADVGHIVTKARKQKQAARVLMVYVVPELRKFLIPTCASLADNDVIVAAGQVNADFFPRALRLLAHQQEVEQDD